MHEFIDIEQNTPEWDHLRAGKLTGSQFGTVMANYGKSFGDPAKNLAMKLATEQITGNPIKTGYKNEHMERGHAQEPDMVRLYSAQNFVEVTNGGFYDCGFIGCSPDGHVPGGIIEGKSVIAHVHLKTIKGQKFSTAYKWQLIGNMHFTDSDFIDFVSYCADFPEDKRIYVCRLNRPSFKTEVEQMLERFDKFEELVNEYKEVILNSNYEVEI